jgi:Rieske Fe-S protein
MIEDPKSENISRRDFIKKSGGAVAVLTAGSVVMLSSCESFIEKAEPLIGKTVEIDVNSTVYKRYLTKTGAGLIKKFDSVNFGIPVIIVKIADNRYKCYSTMCTHMNCFGSEKFHSPDPIERDMSDVRPPLGTSPEARSIVCRCHGSRFDPFDEGKPTQGPAERPLTQYRCEFNSSSGILRIYF